MSFDNKGDSGIAPWVMAWSSLRQAGGESTTQSKEQIGPLTRVGMMVAHALIMTFSLVWFAAGLWVTTKTMGKVVGVGLEVSDYAIVWVTLLLIGAFIYGALQIADQAIKARILVITTIVLLMLILSLLTAIARNGMGLLDGMALALGYGSILSSSALFYNQGRSITEGEWRESPFERQVSKLLPGMMGQGEGDGVTVILEVHKPDGYVTQNRAISSQMPIPDETREEIEGLIQDGAEEVRVKTIDPKIGNLIWFVHFAARQLDLIHGSLTMEPAPILPYKEKDTMGRWKEKRLRKPMIVKLLNRGEKYGYWEQGGPGKIAEWKVSRKGAMDDAANRWKEVMGDEPIPIYYSGADYVTHSVRPDRAA